MKRVLKRIPKIVWIALFSKVCFAKFGVIFAFMKFYLFYSLSLFLSFFKRKKRKKNLYSFLPPYVLFRFFKLILTYAICLKNVEIQDVRLCEMFNVTFTNYKGETRKETFLNDL